ncbi:MAG: flagellar biosynthetic protein FliO [Leptospiraceae bacterium]|nr:flagellar biosynthetic protein FliO [Leptospiraceae bacterium]MDW8306447.1 flagellar biosynthetic protein FliO [Leptospiraceae bacterium]
MGYLWHKLPKPFFWVLTLVLFLPCLANEPNKATKSEEESFEKLLEKELSQETERSAPKPSWLAQLVKTTLVLAIFLGVFYVIYRTYVFRKSLPQKKTRAFRLIYNFPLGTGKSLQVVEIPNRLLILGVSEAGIELIREIQDRAEMELIRLECEKDMGEKVPDFFHELKEEITRKAREVFGTKFTASISAEEKELMEDYRKRSQAKLQKLRHDRDSLRREDL